MAGVLDTLPASLGGVDGRGSDSQSPLAPRTPATTTIGLLADVLRQHGPSVVIALWFTYWLTAQVSATIAAVQRDLTEHMRLSSFFSRQICINTARDEVQRASCEPSTR